jgi:hypothetical protein
VAERLLDDDPGAPGQPRPREALHDPPEEKRRDLEIEHRQRRAGDRFGHTLVRRVVGEVARDV